MVILPVSLEVIGVESTKYTNINKVYYKGTPEAWSKVAIRSGNDLIKSAELYYYSETQPTDTNYKYWHYDADGNPTPW